MSQISIIPVVLVAALISPFSAFAQGSAGSEVHRQALEHRQARAYRAVPEGRTLFRYVGDPAQWPSCAHHDRMRVKTFG
jgi:hypothetical protein